MWFVGWSSILLASHQRKLWKHCHFHLNLRMALPLPPDPLLIQARQHEGGSCENGIQQGRAKSQVKLLDFHRSYVYLYSIHKRIARHPCLSTQSNSHRLPCACKVYVDQRTITKCPSRSVFPDYNITFLLFSLQTPIPWILRSHQKISDSNCWHNVLHHDKSLWLLMDASCV